MTVLDELVKSNRTPILFIGAGISKRYLLNYPSWSELLEKSFSKFEPDFFQYQKHIDECKRNKYSEFKTNAYMGTIIEREFNKAFFDRKISLNIGNRKNPNWVKRRISPYKMFLSDYFKHQKLNNSPKLIEELGKLKELKNKISAVITTNYDNFLEKEVFPNDFQVFVRQHELFSADSYNIAEIYKIHGSVSDAESIIITEEDYNQFKQSRKLIIAKMLTLFSESPIIFLGYSFTDEDVREIIEDFLGCLTDEQVANIRKHFIFVSYKEKESKLIEVERTIITEKGKQIPFVEIQTDNYGTIYDKLGEITPGISPLKVRETRKVIKTIVDQNMSDANAESVIVGIDDLSEMDFSSKPLAIAIGYKENILNRYGYGILEENYIFEDIIYDNKRFDKEAMCNERYKNIPKSRLLPVFKYIKGQKINSDSKLAAYIENRNSIEKIISSSVTKYFNRVPVLSNLLEIKEAMQKQDSCRKAALVVLKNINVLKTKELRDVCIYLFKCYPNEYYKDSYSKRCILCLDLKENYLQ